MNILFITHPYPNYIPDLLLHGLRKLIGPSVVDFPRKDCVYDGVLGLGVCPEDQLCRGWFPPDRSVDRHDIWQKVHANFFEYVVCDCRSIQTLSKHLTKWPKKLVIIDGEDRPVRIAPGKFLVCRRETDGFDPSIPLPMAIPEEVLQWIALYDGADKEYSVGFLGSSNGGMRTEIAEMISSCWPDALLQHSTVPTNLNPHPNGRMSRDDYYLHLQKCKVLLSLPGAGYDTFRFWENAACEGVHVSACLPLLVPDDFVEGRHIFRFRSVDDLRSLVSRILDGETRAKEISEEARRHLHQFHTTTSRAKYFLDRVKIAFG